MININIYAFISNQESRYRRTISGRQKRVQIFFRVPTNREHLGLAREKVHVGLVPQISVPRDLIDPTVTRLWPPE